MGTKMNPGKHDCYNHLAIDEPYFLLMARDPCGAKTVEGWARARKAWLRDNRWYMTAEQIQEQEDKIAEALKCADDMRKWFLNNTRRVEVKGNLSYWELGNAEENTTDKEANQEGKGQSEG